MSACGEDVSTPEEDQYAGFDVAETPVEQSTDVGDQMASEPEPAEEETPSADEGTQSSNDTPMINHDVDDVGEDLFRRGFQQDAMALWEANAEAGDAYAAYRLGVEYFDGNFVEQNIELSLRYQTLAAELGNAAAMFELGSFIEAGLGVRQDMQQAAGWYLASALRGYAPAQHNVATMYEDGVGVPRDLVQAYLFYSLAKGQGFSMNFELVHTVAEGERADFVDTLARLQTLMSEEQLLEAQSLIDDFAPLN